MIIGLHGSKRSGKDTVCNFIEKYHTGKVVRRSFAGPLKLSAYRLIKPDATLEEALAWADLVKEEGRVEFTWDEPTERGDIIPRGATISGRELLQRYGTEAHRDVFGTNFWVDVSLPEWDGMGHSESGLFGIDHQVDLVVYTDVRFVNEAMRIRQWGGVIWEIRRDAVEGGDTHASEVRLPEEMIDGTLKNNGTLEDLGHMVEALMAIHALRMEEVNG